MCAWVFIGLHICAHMYFLAGTLIFLYTLTMSIAFRQYLMLLPVASLFHLLMSVFSGCHSVN